MFIRLLSPKLMPRRSRNFGRREGLEFPSIFTSLQQRRDEREADLILKRLEKKGDCGYGARDKGPLTLETVCKDDKGSVWLSCCYLRNAFDRSNPREDLFLDKLVPMAAPRCLVPSTVSST